MASFDKLFEIHKTIKRKRVAFEKLFSSGPLDPDPPYGFAKELGLRPLRHVVSTDGERLGALIETRAAFVDELSLQGMLKREEYHRAALFALQSPYQTLHTRFFDTVLPKLTGELIKKLVACLEDYNMPLPAFIVSVSLIVADENMHEWIDSFRLFLSLLPKEMLCAASPEDYNNTLFHRLIIEKQDTPVVWNIFRIMRHRVFQDVYDIKENSFGMTVNELLNNQVRLNASKSFQEFATKLNSIVSGPLCKCPAIICKCFEH